MSTNTAAEWYYARNGAQNGPFDIATFRQMIAAGQLYGQDLAWRDGMPNWMPISQIPELQAGGFASPQANPGPAASNFAGQPAYGAEQSYSPQSNYAAPVGYAQGNVGRGPSQQGMAIAGLILAFVFPLLGLIFSIIALNGMKTNRNDEGRGLALAGLFVSIGWMVLACLWFILVFGMIGAAAASGGH